MTDLDAVYAAVLREPHVDLHRGAWADLLDERADPGDAARAEFVRLQLEEAALLRRGAAVLVHKASQDNWSTYGCDDDCPRCQLLRVRTKAELMEAVHSPEWWPEPPVPGVGPWACAFRRSAFKGVPTNWHAVEFRRGLPHAVRVPESYALGPRCPRCRGERHVLVRLPEGAAGMAMGLQELRRPPEVLMPCAACKAAGYLPSPARALFGKYPLVELWVTDARGRPQSRPDLVNTYRAHHGLPPAA